MSLTWNSAGYSPELSTRLAVRFVKSARQIGRDGDPLQFVKPGALIAIGPGDEHRREKLPERRVVLGPALTDKSCHRFVRMDFMATASLPPAPNESAIENEAGETLGMQSGIGR